MEFYQVIENRNSANKFSDEPVDKDSLVRIINAAMKSPSWKNNTSYRIVFVDDIMLKQTLAQAILNDTDEMEEALKQAPIVAVVVGDSDQSGTVEVKAEKYKSPNPKKDVKEHVFLNNFGEPITRGCFITNQLVMNCLFFSNHLNY